MSDRHEPTVSADLREQIAKQCEAVAHMARALAQTHGDLAAIIRAGGPVDVIAERIGASTAKRMETLGDMLNAMDAVTEDDDWLGPVFRAAQERWPA